MLKFLRKYNKYILVVGGSLLMVAFIAPQAIQQLGPNPLKQTHAYIGSKRVTVGRNDQAAREREAIMTFSPLFAGLGLGLRRNDPPAHWLLLAEEAERGGFIAELNDGVDWMPELAREIVEIQLALQFGDLLVARQRMKSGNWDGDVDLLEQQLWISRVGAMSAARMNEEEFGRTLTKARGVHRMLEAYRDAPKFSSSRATTETKRDRDRVFADVVWISAARLATLDDIRVTDDEVRAHFERFRDDDGSDNEFGYGYTLAPRVKLAWIEIDADVMAFGVRLDAIAVKKEYQRNRALYPGEFAEERLTIESRLNRAEIDKIVSEADRIILKQTAPVLSGLKKEGVHRVLPDGKNPFPSWEQIAEAVVEGVRESTGHTIPMPIVQVRDSGWLDGQAITAIEGIGSATVRAGSRQVSFASAVLSVKELNETEALGLQVGVPMVRLPAQTVFGVRYYYTVLDARDTSPPDDPSEIWERLVRDTRELKAYERLVAESDTILGLARAEGLAELAVRYSPPEDDSGDDQADDITDPAEVFTPEEWDKAPLLGLNVQSDVLVRWDPRSVITNIGGLQTESFATAVMEAAGDLDPMFTRDAIPGEKRWLVVRSPETKGLAIVKLGVWAPITQESFWSGVTSAVERARAEEVLAQEGLEGQVPYTFDAMRKRMDYRAVGVTEEAIEADDEADDEADEG